VPDEARSPGTDPRPRVNPGGIVYGVLAVATVIAAESTRRETFVKLFAASLLTMALYWIAHAYSHHWGSRLNRAGEWSLAEIVQSLAYEASILVGAGLPSAVLVGAWLAGATKNTAVTIVLWCAAVELLLLEVVPGIRHRLRLRDTAVQALVGLSMGIGVLGLHVVLH